MGKKVAKKGVPAKKPAPPAAKKKVAPAPAPKNSKAKPVAKAKPAPVVKAAPVKTKDVPKTPPAPKSPPKVAPTAPTSLTSAKPKSPEAPKVRAKENFTDKLDLQNLSETEKTWLSLYEKHKTEPLADYKMSGIYEPNTCLVHKVMGWGYILNVQNDRLEVAFKDGVKFLISNYNPK